MALKKKVVSMYSLDDYKKMSEEYSELSNQIKELDARKKQLSDLLKKGATDLGVKDDKGSYYVDADNYIFGTVARKSVSLKKDDALNFLRDKGFDDCIKEEVVYSVDEKKLEDYVTSGEIAQEDFENLLDVKTSYAVTVKKKEEMTEAEKGILTLAARKK